MKKRDLVQIKRITVLYLIGFLLVFGYAIARPSIDSIFLEHYSTDMLPTAGLLTAIVSALVLTIYNRVNQKYSILLLYGSISLICAIILLCLLGAYLSGFISVIFVIYIFKEIYMVVLMETYWSYADIVFSIGTARFTYGFAMAISSFGGVLGNLVVGPLSKKLGTPWALSSIVLFLMLGFFIAFFTKDVADTKPKSSTLKPDMGVGLKTLLNSRYLVPLALLVCTVQVVVGLIDFRFMSLLKLNYADMDLRTEFLGQVHAAVNVFAVIIQAFTGPILRLIGIGFTFKGIPFLLGAFILCFITVPHFAFMIAAKISSKALDYSLLRATKEIFYIPLSREEKTQGKGIIDIFMYRQARGLASLILIGLTTWGLASYIMELSLILTLIWLILAIIIAKRYQALVKYQSEL